MGRKKLTKAEKIRRYVDKHPNAAAKEVAEALGVSVGLVHHTRWRLKNAEATPKTAKPKAEFKTLFMATSGDPVNHPKHYKYGGVETIDFIESKGLGYHLGNVVKYISRAGMKGTNTGLEDLKKAQWYLNRAIEKNEYHKPTR